MSMITVVPTAAELLELLDAMADAGQPAEVAGADATGSAFLATLIDGELTVHVPEDAGTMPCPECDPDSDALNFLPHYPVHVLGWFPMPAGVSSGDAPAAVRGELRPAVESTTCPECEQGKCGNCDGTSWSNELDAPVDCPCAVRGHKLTPPGVTP